ncbi:hypothetical protein [Pelobacter seleniigenes]|uniref:hypothetical protein n=1 Tax=Pelobacter seleniigenes TaxID=407188 RepID=UPI0004A6F6B1|nr:hypothetical protein [Pelobacter seleniigenes]
MEACLKKSIEQYRRIVDHAQQLERLLRKSDPSELGSYTAQLQELQDEASLNDRVFYELFSRNSEAWRNHPLFIERSELIEEIVKMNHLLLPKIRGMMAVAAHEIAQIKAGRTAMNGYNQTLHKNKRSLVRGVG